MEFDLSIFTNLFIYNLLLTCIGEWWNGPVQAIEDYMKLTGDGPNSSNAYTINGLPGSLYQCSKKGKMLIDRVTLCTLSR